jgi:hypothetical protein
MEAGRPAAGSSRTGGHRASTIASPWRLDPFSLPVRFAAVDQAADAGLRMVDLHRERVVLRRALGGMRMAVNLPVAAYRGVAIKVHSEDEGPPRLFSVTLDHPDAGLSLPLFSSQEPDDIVAEWQCWGRVLGMPLLLAESDGSAREVFPRMGRLLIAAPTWRRRRRSTIARRRPYRVLRRRATALPASPLVHRGEREIIGRE